MFKEHEQIALTACLTGDNGEELKPGDVGTVIHIHPNQQAFVVEFNSPDGSTFAIATVLPCQARSSHAGNLPATL